MKIYIRNTYNKPIYIFGLHIIIDCSNILTVPFFFKRAIEYRLEPKFPPGRVKVTP